MSGTSWFKSTFSFLFTVKNIYFEKGLNKEIKKNILKIERSGKKKKKKKKKLSWKFLKNSK